MPFLLLIAVIFLCLLTRGYLATHGTIGTGTAAEGVRATITTITVLDKPSATIHCNRIRCDELKYDLQEREKMNTKEWSDESGGAEEGSELIVARPQAGVSRRGDESSHDALTRSVINHPLD